MITNETIRELENIIIAERDTATRLSDAHAYCQKYLMPSAWGRNVWHAILDDAIRMRKELEKTP